ncbi:MAG: flagellum-specific peptidoglycan hydrolase FlgJ [Paraglaciecola sp.]|jgi:flagellum-specific peptidoglycan hydrolase FlgJ
MNRTNQDKGIIYTFARKNWYKLAFLGFLMYIFLQKDLSFSVNLNAPFRTEEPVPAENQPRLQSEKKTLEKLSETQDRPVLVKIPEKAVSRFSFPFFGTDERQPNIYDHLAQFDNEVKLAYLERFANVAINERKKFGVPSSIILANALLHSTSGRNDLAHNGNNHFAMACDATWTEDRGDYHGQCFRHYDNAWSSFRDHSNYVTTGRFLSMRQLSSIDYKAWAVGLEREGFSSEPDLAGKLVQLIEEFQLYELDKR